MPSPTEETVPRDDEVDAVFDPVHAEPETDLTARWEVDLLPIDWALGEPQAVSHGWEPFGFALVDDLPHLLVRKEIVR